MRNDNRLIGFALCVILGREDMHGKGREVFLAIDLRLNSIITFFLAIISQDTISNGRVN